MEKTYGSEIVFEPNWQKHPWFPNPDPTETDSRDLFAGRLSLWENEKRTSDPQEEQDEERLPPTSAEDVWKSNLHNR